MNRFAKPWYKSRTIRLYRDDTNLPATSDLWTTIYDALDKSRYFILIASPKAARSEGVSQEIKYWLEHHSSDTILIALTHGSLHWDRSANDFDWQRTDAIPRCLKKAFDSEPKYADFRGKKSRKTFWSGDRSFGLEVANLVAKIRGVEKDTLVGEHIRQHRRTLRTVLVACAILTVTSIIAIYGALVAVEQRKIALHKGQMDLARYLGVQSEQLLSEGSGISLLRGTLLAIESARRFKTLSSHSALIRSLRLLPRPIRIFKHDYAPYDIATNQNGNLLLTASGNFFEHYLHIWDLSTGSERIRLKHAAKIEDMAMIHNDRSVATVTAQFSPLRRGFGMNLGIWDVSNRLKTVQLEDKKALNPAKMGPNGRLLAALRNKRYIRVWDVVKGNRTLEVIHNYGVHSISLSPKKDRLALVDQRETFVIRNTHSGRITLQGKPKGGCRKVIFNPTGNHLLVTEFLDAISITVHIYNPYTNDYIAGIGPIASQIEFAMSPIRDLMAAITKDKSLCVWDLTTGQRFVQLDREFTGGAIASNPHGDRLATGEQDDAAIRIWDLNTGKEQFRLSLQNPIHTLAFSQCGHRLVGTTDTAVHIWDLTTQEEICIIPDVAAKKILFSPDGRMLAVLDRQHIIRLWDLATMQELTWRFSKSGSYRMVFSPSGDHLFIIHNQRGIWLWDITSDQRHFVLPRNGLSTEGAFLSPDGDYAVVASREDAIRVWDMLTQEELNNLIHPSTIKDFSFSIDGKRIATFSPDGTLLIWNLKNRKPSLRLRHDASIEAITFSSDGDRLASGSNDRTARVWDALTGSEIARFKHPSGVQMVALNHLGHKLATMDKANVMRIWDIQSRSELANIPQEFGLNCLTFSPSGDTLATAGEDNTARIWAVDTGEELFRIAHNDEVEKVMFLPTENRLVTASQDSLVGVWGLDGWSQVIMHKVHDEDVIDVAYNASGEKLISTSKDNTARIWDIKTGQETARLVHGATIQSVAFSSSGDRVATGSEDKTARVWDVTTGRELLSLPHMAKINTVAFSDTGDLFVTGGSGVWNLFGELLTPRIKLWRLDSGKRLASFPHQSEVLKAFFTFSGNRLVTTDGHAIRVWDIAREKEIITMKPERRPYGGIKEMSMNPAEDRLATANFDGTVSVWDLTNSKELIRLAHEDHINSVAFGFKDDVLATGGKDGIVRIWDLTTGNEIARLIHDLEVTGLAFSPTSDQLATASGKSVQVWVWRFEDIMQEVCSRVPRNFTIQEWQLYLGNETYQPTCPDLPGDSFGERALRFISRTKKNFQYGADTRNPNQINWPKH
jgi:WD40 repeat protein